MNKTRRRKIQLIINALQDNLNHLEDLKQEEEESFNNLPESLQESERGEAMENAISNLDDAVTYLGEVIDYLESAME